MPRKLGKRGSQKGSWKSGSRGRPPKKHNRILTSISGRQIRDVGDEEGAHAEGEGVVAVRTSRSGRTLRPSRR